MNGSEPRFVTEKEHERNASQDAQHGDTGPANGRSEKFLAARGTRTLTERDRHHDYDADDHAFVNVRARADDFIDCVDDRSQKQTTENRAWNRANSSLQRAAADNRSGDSVQFITASQNVGLSRAGVSKVDDTNHRSGD